MPKAYSEDLRVRVLAAYRSGMSVANVCEQFKISRFCVYDWDKLEREKGSLKPQYENCTGRSSTIKPDENFEEFAKIHAYSTLKQMAETWSSANKETVSLMAVSRSLKKLGWTHKKRPATTKNAAKKNAKIF